jgi:hypothetical protein
MNKNRFVTAITLLAANWNKTYMPETIALFFKKAQIAGLTIEQIESAVNRLIDERRGLTLPVWSEILDAAGAGEAQISFKAESEADRVIEMISSVGGYAVPKFEDPITSSLLSRRWRWRSLCRKPESEMVWFRKEFITAYTNCAAFFKIDVAIGRDKISGLLANIGRSFE